MKNGYSGIFGTLSNICDGVFSVNCSADVFSVNYSRKKLYCRMFNRVLNTPLGHTE